MRIIFIIISILFYSSTWIDSLEIPIITNIQDMIGLAHDVGDIVGGNIPFKSFFSPVANPIFDVLDKIDGIAEKIDNLDTKLDNLLATLIARLPLEDQINTDVRDLQQHISTIENIFDEFLEYAENITLFEEDTLLEFVNTVVSNKPGNVPYILNSIYNIIVPSTSALSRTSFLENMLSKRKLLTPQDKCGSPIAFQTRLLQIYNLITITEMEAYLMTMFGFRLKRELQNAKSIGEIARTRTSFVMRLEQYLIQFTKILKKCSREIYLCDSEDLKNTSNYIEFEGLFTAFVVNEKQLNDACSNQCSDIWRNSNESNACYNYESHYCEKHPCRGITSSCSWIGGDVDICEYPEGTRKRYEWVRSYTNGWYGEYSQCNNGTYEQVNGWFQDIYRCDTCICRCEETYGSSLAIRTVSLRPQVSNVFYNKVVSDVRFVLKDKMLHIQIEEAPLLPMGQFNKNESDWVRLEDFVYLPSLDEGGFLRQKYRTYTPMVEGKDFAFIKGDLRTIHLDEISGGPNKVLTGVRFTHDWEGYKDKSGRNTSPLRLEIHVTPFDYKTGQVNPTEDNPSLWISPMGQANIPLAYNNEREELGNGAEKTYTRKSVENIPNLLPNKLVKIKQSSIHDDAGQTTLPFFDSRPTAPGNVFVYDGVGLAYRGHEEYGGFVMLKTIVHDATHYIDSAMTDDQRKYYSHNFRQSVPNTPSRRRGSRRRQ